MSDDEDGGEHTNAEYYGRVWTKPVKKRLEPKKAKVKSKEITNVLIATLNHLERMGDRWVYADHSNRRTSRRSPKG
jgi:hypothetical protein